MTLSCLRRPARPEDRLPEWIGAAFCSTGDPAIVDAARLVGRDGPVTWWVIPTEQSAICFFEAHEGGGDGGGCLTDLASLRESGMYSMPELRAGRWRCALLVADGFEWARAGAAEVPVVDNFALLEMPERDRVVVLSGPAGRRWYHLPPVTGPHP